MKYIKMLILLTLLTFLVACNSNKVSIGEYHKFNGNDFDNFEISSMGHSHTNENLHHEEALKVYDNIICIKPLESVSEKDNKKVLTTLNYIIEVDINKASYHIEMGDNYIAISSEDNADKSFINTVHLVDEDDMKKLKDLIESIFH